ncbi:unnamed protein product, partial [Ectocarpus sp. 12 AP-2014]
LSTVARTINSSWRRQRAWSASPMSAVRLYTETKIWIPSSSAWMANTERRLEET